MATSLTLFTFGYWGWGTSTPQLIQAVDAVEGARGYEPPIFADIRIRRAVRAPGFSGSAFERAIGADRYRWIRDLGNLGILEGGGIRIKNPQAAEGLLDLALDSMHASRRVLFFCACSFPGPPDNPICHRCTVAGLVLDAAKRRRVSATVVEWPGGEPVHEGPEIQATDALYKALLHGRSSIPLPRDSALAAMAGLPWGSVVTVTPSRGNLWEPVKIGVGPARYSTRGWYLPVIGTMDPDGSPETIRKAISQWRNTCGLDARMQ